MRLLPDLIAQRVTDLTPELLQRRGVRLLMMDFDNTLLPYTTDCPTKEVTDWLEGMKAAGIQLCVVSNSRKERVQVFCRKYGIECVIRARKPFSRGIRECLTRFSAAPGEAALVGDQIYTDVLGAKRQGVQAILVGAIHNHTIWLKLRHGAELPWIALARKRRIK